MKCRRDDDCGTGCAGSCGGIRAGLADAADPRDHSVRRRQRDRPRPAHRVRPAFAAARPADRGGEPHRRRRHARHQRGRQGRSRRLHAARPFECAYGVARDLREPALRHRQRLRAGCPVRQPADGADHVAVQGLQDHSGDGRRRQGQARHVQLRFGRRRLRHASQRGKVQAQRRLRGDPRAVPRRARRR